MRYVSILQKFSTKKRIVCLIRPVIFLVYILFRFVSQKQCNQQLLIIEAADMDLFYNCQSKHTQTESIYEPVHEISNNLVCATSKGSDQPAHTRRLIRAFACRLNIL